MRWNITPSISRVGNPGGRVLEFFQNSWLGVLILYIPYPGASIWQYHDIFIWLGPLIQLVQRKSCIASSVFFFKVKTFNCFRISTVKHGPITDFKFPSCDVIRFDRARLAPVLVASPPPPSRVDVQLGLVSPFQSFPDVRICVTGWRRTRVDR